MFSCEAGSASPTGRAGEAGEAGARARARERERGEKAPQRERPKELPNNTIMTLLDRRPEVMMEGEDAT